MPDSFLFCFFQKKSEACADSLPEGFSSKLFFETAQFRCHLIPQRSDTLAVKNSDGLTVLLHGEIYNRTQDQAGYVLEQFLEKGVLCAKDLNGSFAALIFDKRKNNITVITDRVNSRKLFWGRTKNGFWISSSLYFPLLAEYCLDVTAVACYLSNGALRNNRTLFDGVRTLDRASTHQLTGEGFVSQVYWELDFTSSYSNPETEEDLSRQLSEILVESVRIRLNDAPQLFLSLTGGYDSRCLLGIVKYRLKAENVKCVTFALSGLSQEQQKDSDAFLAREMALFCGYEHELLQTYDQNLLELITMNVDLFQGVGHFCDDVKAWSRYSNVLLGSESPVIFAGDECFGLNLYGKEAFWSLRGALGMIRCYDFGGLDWLEDHLSPQSFSELRNLWNDEFGRIMLRKKKDPCMLDTQLFFYLDQKIPNELMSWREFFMGQHAVVRSPFLDNALLDFMKKVPWQMRFRKTLFKKTVRRMFPELFRFPVARKNTFTPDWQCEIARQKQALLSKCLEGRSSLDAIIPAELLASLLGQMEAGQKSCLKTAKQREWKARLLHTMSPRIMETVGCFMRRFMGYQYRTPAVDSPTFLKRALTLRLFLKKIFSGALRWPDPKENVLAHDE